MARLRLRDRTRLHLVAGRAEYALLVVHLHAELTRPADRQRPGLEHYLLLRIGRDDEHALVLPRVSHPVGACVAYARAHGPLAGGAHQVAIVHRLERALLHPLTKLLGVLVGRLGVKRLDGDPAHLWRAQACYGRHAQSLPARAS